MTNQFPYRIFPLGDAALTIDFGNIIDEGINITVLELFDQLKANPLPGQLEAVPAYSSLTIYYNTTELFKMIPPGTGVFEWMSQQARQFLDKPTPPSTREQRTMTVPVCYDEYFAPDISQVAAKNNISVEEVIRLHTGKQFRVYMLGFLPGFSYMGELDEKMSMPRKEQPRMVSAGSVGIAGRQTGIYPQASPGGWQIIGRTPMKLFDPQQHEPVVLHAGDIVQFIPISKDEFANY
ncbi:MAG TPA: 5-oxoprolinase subunit PxpB [Chitinophagaceae bacterium]